MPVPRRLSPEERYLQKKRAELATLEAQLAERELEVHTLRGGLISFEAQYDAMVSAKYEALDELRIRIMELSPPPVELGPSSENPAKTESKSNPPNRSSRRRDKGKGSPKPPPAPAPPMPPDFNPAESLKKLYREVAKTMHPDLADDDQNRAHRHQYMIRANEAYEAGNEAKLLEVFEDWQHSAETVRGHDAAAELVRVIRKIDRCERRLVEIAAEIEQLQTSGMFGMKIMADEAAEFQRDLLAEMTQRLDEDIAAARELVARLEASNPAPSAPPPAPVFDPPLS